MTTEEIKKEILSWENGDTISRQKKLCFTSWVVDFNEKKEVFTTTYKPKVWIECNFKDFFFLLQGQGTQKKLPLSKQLLHRRRKSN